MADASGRAPRDTGDDWRDRLVEDGAAVAALARTFRRVAVVGIRPASAAGRPAHDVAAWLRVVWMQLGSREPQVAEACARAGLLVVQDRCLQRVLAGAGC